jgi:hypothetical protein
VFALMATGTAPSKDTSLPIYCTRALASMAGLSTNAIGAWEKGERTLHPNHVAFVERALVERGVVFLDAPPGLRAGVPGAGYQNAAH